MGMTQQLMALADRLRDPSGAMSGDSLLCQQAAVLITTQENQIAALQKQREERRDWLAEQLFIHHHRVTVDEVFNAADIFVKEMQRRSRGEDS